MWVDFTVTLQVMLIERLIEIFMANCQRYRHTIRRCSKILLATSDFAKRMQDDINLYVTRDRLNNATFRQKLDQISKIPISRSRNPLKPVFQDISTFDAQNPVAGSLLRELNIGKKAHCK